MAIRTFTPTYEKRQILAMYLFSELFEAALARSVLDEYRMCIGCI